MSKETDTDTYEIFVDSELDWGKVTTYDEALINFGRICARENHSAGERLVAMYEGTGAAYPVKEEKCGFDPKED